MSHGFTTVSPRRRGSQCSINILSLLQLRSSWSGDRLRVKLWPFGTRMAYCLRTSWARPQCRLTSGTSGRTLTWTSPFITTTRGFIYRHLRPRVGNLRNWYGRWFQTRRTVLTWRHSTSIFSDHWRTFSVASISQMTANWRWQCSKLWCKNIDKEFYRAGFQQRARRWEKYVLVNGTWEERLILTAWEAGCGYVLANANSHFVEQISINMWC